MSFKVGMRVVVIDENHEIKKGVINRIYESMEIAIVKFDDGNVEKVPYDCLGIDPETKTQEEKPIAPVEKSEITITPDEFKKIATKIISEESVKSGSPIIGLTFSIFSAKIHKALFIEEGEND